MPAAVIAFLPVVVFAMLLVVVYVLRRRVPGMKRWEQRSRSAHGTKTMGWWYTLLSVGFLVIGAIRVSTHHGFPYEFGIAVAWAAAAGAQFVNAARLREGLEAIIPANVRRVLVTPEYRDGVGLWLTFVGVSLVGLIVGLAVALAL